MNLSKQLFKSFYLFLFLLFFLPFLNSPIIKAAGNDFTVLKGVITKYNGSSTTVTVPASINGEPIKSIGNGAFQGNSVITSVTISEGIKELKDNVFKNCNNLAAVILPSSVKSIGSDVFTNTSWLETSRISNPLVISNHILIDGKTCTGTVDIPEGISCIAKDCFANASAIEWINFPSTLPQDLEQGYEYMFTCFIGTAYINKITYNGINNLPSKLEKGQLYRVLVTNNLLSSRLKTLQKQYERVPLTNPLYTYYYTYTLSVTSSNVEMYARKNTTYSSYSDGYVFFRVKDVKADSSKGEKTKFFAFWTIHKRNNATYYVDSWSDKKSYCKVAYLTTPVESVSIVAFDLMPKQIMSASDSSFTFTKKGEKKNYSVLFNNNESMPTNPKIKWYISDSAGNYNTFGKSVASVNNKGVVTAKGPGSTYVTVAAKESYDKKTKTYAVKDTISVVCPPVEEISFSSINNIQTVNTKINLYEQLLWNPIEPFNKEKMKLKWTSSNKQIASVTSKGMVLFKNNTGTVIITVEAVGGVPKNSEIPKVSIEFTIEQERIL